MMRGGSGRRTAAWAALTAGVLVIVVGCSSSGEEPDERPSASSSTTPRGPAVECSTSVAKALVLTWGVSTGRPSGTDTEAAMAAFLVASQGKPEQSIYEDYRALGLADLAQGRVEKGSGPAELLNRYSPGVRQDCTEAYPE